MHILYWWGYERKNIQKTWNIRRSCGLCHSLLFAFLLRYYRKICAGGTSGFSKRKRLGTSENLCPFIPYMGNCGASLHTTSLQSLCMGKGSGSILFMYFHLPVFLSVYRSFRQDILSCRHDISPHLLLYFPFHLLQTHHKSKKPRSVFLHRSYAFIPYVCNDSVLFLLSAENASFQRPCHRRLRSTCRKLLSRRQYSWYPSYPQTNTCKNHHKNLTNTILKQILLWYNIICIGISKNNRKQSC